MFFGKRKRDEDTSDRCGEDVGYKLWAGVRQPSWGSKFYKSIILENGLTVCLVSDETIAVGSAALTVRVGTFDDPESCQGLAHFLEHMVFMGSEKYRGNNGLNGFLAQHGGVVNAITKSEHTIYYMGVNVSHLKRALERFAHLFIGPLFGDVALDSELHAVDSEFKLARTNDKCRLDLLRAQTSEPGHVFSKFSWGNTESLLADGLHTLGAHTRNLFRTGYIGASMKLAVLGDETVDALEEWVTNSFKGVRRGVERSPRLNHPTPTWTSNSTFVLKAVRDIHLFEISWMIPPMDPVSFSSKPEIYLVQVLGHECKGSLLSFFKDKGWATSLSVTAGATDKEDDSDYCSTGAGRLFTISLDLTLAGVKQKYEMVSYIYQYLDLVRGEPSVQVMSEYTQIKQIQFDCFDIDSDPLVFTQRLAANMLHYPVEHVLSCDYLGHSCTRAAFDNLLTYFKPDNMRLDLVTSSFKAADDNIQTDRLFDLQYIEETIPICFKYKWTHIDKVDDYLSLPPVNNYLATTDTIARNLFEERDSESSEREPKGLKSGGSDSVSGGSERESIGSKSGGSDSESGGSDSEPEMFVVKPCMTLWHKQEEVFPYVKFFVYLNVKDEMASHLMIRLFIRLLKDDLTEILYQGKQAWFIPEVREVEYNRVAFEFKGCGESLPVYISAIWQKFCSFLPTSESRFELIKEDLASDISNQIFDIKKYSVHLMEEVLSKAAFGVDKMLEVLEKINLDNLSGFIPFMRSQIYIEGICYGHLTKLQAEDISRLIQCEEMSSLPLKARVIPRVDVPCGVFRKDAKVKSNSDVNSSAKVYFQIGNENYNAKETGLVHLFSAMFKDGLSQQLRTTEKLGYYVGCEAHFLGPINGLSLDVVSPLRDPEHLLTRIDSFMEGFPERLGDLDDRIFRNYKRSACFNLPDVCGDDIWVQIGENRYRRGYYSDVKRELEQLKKDDLIEFHKNYFIETSPKRRKALICIWGCNTVFPAEPVTGNE